MRPFLTAVVVAVLAGGCAPTTMSPAVLRYLPGSPKTLAGSFGLRSGPRVSAPLATEQPFGFRGDDDVFNLGQWSLAYDLAGTYPLSDGWALHFGAQGEFYYPLPLPGYGLYAGTSRFFELGAYSICPALTARGATDFGLQSVGGPGTVVGGEASVTFAYRPEPNVAVAIVPFVSGQFVQGRAAGTPALYVGAALAAHHDGIELSGGFGRVFFPDGTAWNAPIIGVRIGGK